MKFSSNGLWRRTDEDIYGGEVADTLCTGGEGGNEYAGKWEYSKDGISIRYRLMDRLIHKVGEELPGPILTLKGNLIQNSTGTQELVIDRDTFVRFDNFCAWKRAYVNWSGRGWSVSDHQRHVFVFEIEVHARGDENGNPVVWVTIENPSERQYSYQLPQARLTLEGREYNFSEIKIDDQKARGDSAVAFVPRSRHQFDFVSWRGLDSSIGETVDLSLGTMIEVNSGVLIDLGSVHLKALPEL